MATLSMKYPQRAFGLPDLKFFLAVLRACPPGARLSFDRSETESFVQAFRPWSRREDASSFEAYDYRIDAGFIAGVEQAIERGTLQLDHHFGIVASDGRPLCSSMDDFAVVTLAAEVEERILKEC